MTGQTGEVGAVDSRGRARELGAQGPGHCSRVNQQVTLDKEFHLQGLSFL